jgi:hypothetical protein
MCLCLLLSYKNEVRLSPTEPHLITCLQIGPMCQRLINVIRIHVYGLLNCDTVQFGR